MLKRKNVVISGGAGLLALNIAAYKNKDWEITLIVRNYEVSIEDVETEKIDLENTKLLEEFLIKKNPDLFIHAAGITDVDYCEENFHPSRLSNVVTSKNIATITEKLGISLVHISTDHFSKSDKEYSAEDEIELPVNEYAKTKLEAEFEVRRANSNALILRTNFFAWGSHRKESISDFIINKLRNNQEVPLFDDIFFTPILTDSLVDKLELLTNEKVTGILNLVGQERVSKYDFGMLIADVFKLDNNLIKKSSIRDANLKTKRPKDMSLSSDKLFSILGPDNSSIKTDLENLKLIESNGRSKIIKSSLDTTKQDFLHYGRQSIDDQDIDSAISTLAGGWLTQGPKINAFEKAITKYTGAKYALAVSNLTSGLHLACLSLGLKAGDYLITSPISFVASANAAVYCGATPLFADIEEDSANINPKNIEEICKKYPGKVKIVIVVHMAGHPCDMEAIQKLSNKYNFKIIEDAAHGLGGDYKTGGKIGNCDFSDIAGFSFHPVKSITTGEGGVLTTNSIDVYKKLCRLRSHGITKGADSFQQNDEAYDSGKRNPWYYEMQELGFNYRITDIQCSLGISQLSKIDSFMGKRREIAAIYDSSFKKLKNLEIIQSSTRKFSGNHLYIVMVKFDKIKMSKGELYSILETFGIKAHVHYIPIPMQPYYKEKFHEDINNYPQALAYYRGAVTLPLHTQLTNKNVEHIVNTLKEVVG